MKKIFNRIIKYTVIGALVCAFSIFTICGIVSYATPNNYTTSSVNDIDFNEKTIPLSIESNNEETLQTSTSISESAETKLKPELMLFNKIPVKQVNLTVEPEKTVMLEGIPFGIKIYTDGVLVVGMTDINTENGTVCPGEEAVLNIGDVILTMNGQKVTSNEEVSEIVSNSNGNAIELEVVREDQTFNTTLQPQVCVESEEVKAGLWVRDSSAGIGMLTYYDPTMETFGGLGHGICDTDTEQIMPLLTGDIVNASISSIDKGKSGYPGQLHGSFTDKNSIGTLKINNDEGVYGYMDESPSDNGEEYVVANKQEVQKGDAQILTTIDNSEPQLYDIKIIGINYSDSSPTKNMMIQITDDNLLEETGGIVQGMSGSPIIQNGKFIGAVTHVFVNEPEKGYAIFADNMIDQSNNLTQTEEAA